MAANDIVINLKEGSFNFINTWCQNCKTTLQKYDQVTAIEPTDLAQYINPVNNLRNYESLIERLISLSERKIIKLNKR